jgi:hypothetical protein
MTTFSLKRILMHAACIICRPSKTTFFFAGILREFALLKV